MIKYFINILFILHQVRSRIVFLLKNGRYLFKQAWSQLYFYLFHKNFANFFWYCPFLDLCWEIFNLFQKFFTIYFVTKWSLLELLDLILYEFLEAHLLKRVNIFNERENCSIDVPDLLHFLNLYVSNEHRDWIKNLLSYLRVILLGNSLFNQLIGFLINHTNDHKGI